MVEVRTDHLDLEQIAQSGQCFRMTKRDDNKFEIIAKDKYLSAFQEGNTVFLECSKEEYKNFWKDYFDLDEDYGKFISAIDKKDSYLYKAAAFGSGIRILNQDIWEMIVSFLISQQNNIKRIRRCISNISGKYGKKLLSDSGVEYYSFPEPEALASLEEDKLMECNLGYRSKYVVRTARAVAEGAFDPKALKELSYPDAKERLLSLYGVGNKVADCICLFALHKTEAFPVDTHIKQVLNEHYQGGFPFERYKGFEGIIQQYIFYYDLNNSSALK